MWNENGVINISTNCSLCAADDNYAEVPNVTHSTIIMSLFLVIGVISALANALFIGYMVYYYRKVTVHDIFILNISLSDFFYIVSFSWNVFPVVIPSIQKPVFSHNTFLCRLLFSSFVLSFFVNICLMASSALASYWKISNSGISLTIPRAWIMVGISYTASILLLSLPTIGVWARITYFRGAGICQMDFSPTITKNHIIFLFVIVFPMLFSTTCIIAFSYYRIYKIVHNSAVNITMHNNSNRIELGENLNHRKKAAKSYSRTDITLAKTLSVVFGLFILSYAPYALANIFYFCNWFKLSLTEGLYLLIISCTNSIFNPIIFYDRRSKSVQRSNITMVRQIRSSFIGNQMHSSVSTMTMAKSSSFTYK
ncbi:Melanopsin-like [Trichoplax sp. H2]|nr:Melanopsin-like [Trichoplax sp. H2]|eukprot:RDD42462.1 Melanopsin-like [Trichoplax sp. H2]